MKWHASAGTHAGVVMPAMVEPEVELQTAPSVGDNENDWLCAWCHNRVANEKDRFSYNGKDEFTFANPEGIRFAIITFSRTLGCREAGRLLWSTPGFRACLVVLSMRPLRPAPGWYLRWPHRVRRSDQSPHRPGPLHHRTEGQRKLCLSLNLKPQLFSPMTSGRRCWRPSPRPWPKPPANRRNMSWSLPAKPPC